MIFWGPKVHDFLILVMVDGLEPFFKKKFPKSLKIHIFRYWLDFSEKMAFLGFKQKKVLKYLVEDGFIILWTKKGHFLRKQRGGWKSPPVTRHLLLTPCQIGLSSEGQLRGFYYRIEHILFYRKVQTELMFLLWLDFHMQKKN